MTRTNGSVLLVIRSNASYCPVVAYQANILARAGMSVVVLEAAHSDKPQPGVFDPCVRREVIEQTPEFGARPPNMLTRWWRSFEFARTVRSKTANYQPHVIIAYDLDSCAAVVPLVGRDGLMTIYSFLEFPDRREPMSWVRRRKLEATIRTSRQVDLVVQPDPYVAAIFTADAGLNRPPLVVPNCPLLAADLSTSPFRTDIHRQLGHSCRIVLYVGNVGPSRGLLSIVRSMPYWPADTVFVCRGLIVPGFADALVREANRLGVADRLIFRSADAFQEDALAVSASADVGMALYEPVSLNFTYLAYASQKLFEYMAAGTAIVANRGPGFDELIDLLGCGLCVDPSSPQEIGDAVLRLLMDHSFREQCGMNGRRLHLERFNYEQQFHPVLERIQAHLSHS